MNLPQQQPVQLEQIGIDGEGRPLFRYRDATPAAVLTTPIVARPWAAYLGAGCLGLIALCVVAFVLVAILIGLSIALITLAIAVVALTICVIVLRSMWRESRGSKG